MKFLALIIFISHFNFLFAQTFSLAKFSIGESRIKLDQSEFEIKNADPNIKVSFISNSVQWIRNESNLLIPRSMVGISIFSDDSNINLHYLKKTIFPVKKNNFYYTEIYVDLFNPGSIEIYKSHQIIDKISFVSKGTKDAKSKQLIDYSCVPYQLSIEGIDDEYLSVGCKMEAIGNLLEQRPRLEVTISSTNLFSENGERPPYTIYLADNSPVEFKLKNDQNILKKIIVKAVLPKRLTRLKLAAGIGPYIYNSEKLNATTNGQIAPSYMLYGKFELTPTTSFKAFDALVYAKTLFNNSGMYFSYDLAEIFDGRILINTLLGFQGLHYKYDKASNTKFEMLYPQGFEVIYKHAFGVENKHLTYGMFLSTDSNEYTNAWIRYGGRFFWELNYINWAHTPNKISMYGLSIGFPIFEAF
jgi:hypothetical protein